MTQSWNGISRLLRRALLAIFLLLPFGFVPGDGAAAVPGTALLRLVHASPDAPALDVYIDQQRVTTALKFADATTYVAVPSGSRAVQVLAAGAGAGTKALIATNVDLQEGLAYTIVAADRLAQIGAVVLTDDLTSDPGSKAYLRLVHASPDAPAVADVAVAGGPVALRNLPFKAASAYLPLDPGTYAFEVRPAGTTQALATTAPLTLEAGQLYTAFVVGELGNGTFRAIALSDNARTGGVGGAPRSGAGGAQVRPVGTNALFLAVGLLAILPLACTRRLRRSVRATA
jgi:hypothetical protein